MIREGSAPMDLTEAIQQRHSVRAYVNKPIEEETRKKLEDEIAKCNAEGNLSMSLVCDEPEAFDSTLAHYGRFSNVSNYIVLAGKESAGLEERCGYYGERIVLLAQQLGLNTCWVALTFKKRFVKKRIPKGEKLVLVISIGYGEDQGKARKSKRISDVTHVPEGQEPPDWFVSGADAALLAPTAVNQQKFLFELLEKKSPEGLPIVDLLSKGGSYSDVDLGIVKLHFEIGAGKDNFKWNEPN